MFGRSLLTMFLYLAKKRQGIIFMLWGQVANENKKYIKQAAKSVKKNPLILTGPHPSPRNTEHRYKSSLRDNFSDAKKHQNQPTNWTLTTD